MRIRVTVTVQTPRHRQRFGLINTVHFVDPTVATHTTNSTCDVSAVVEVDIVGQVVNSLPLDGLSRGLALADRKQFRAVGVNSGVGNGSIRVRSTVTIHTSLSRGNCGVGCLVDGLMTISTVHPQVPDV